MFNITWVLQKILLFSEISEDQVQLLKEAFELLDVDGSGEMDVGGKHADSGSNPPSSSFPKNKRTPQLFYK